MALTKVSGDILQTPLNVGVVTASQVNVGSAVTIHTGGFQIGSSDLHSTGLTVENLNVTGVVTATSFIGDGSALTGIDATALKDSGGNVKVQANTSGAVVTGIITATSFSGDVNSSGVSTFSNVVVGGATTELIVNGDTRITGIITIGESSVTINGNTNIISGVSYVTDFSGGYLTIPPGAVQFFLRNTAPNGWIKANGATISRSAYSDLFDAIGTTFGVGDGSTTFTIPDLRGEFLRSWDDSRGIDSGRGFGTAQTDQNKSHNHGITDPGHNHTATQIFGSRIDYIGGSADDNISGSAGNFRYKAPVMNSNTTGITINNNGGTESRPRNIALLACIKY